MKRLAAQLVGIAVLVLLVVSPVLAWDSGSDDVVVEETSIRTYDAAFTLDADGDLRVVERLAVDFPTSSKHGIFRFWDRADPSAPGVRRVPEDISVTRDGVDEPWERETEQHDRFTVAKIGSADVFLPAGLHTYVIAYTMPDAIVPGTTGEPAQFYWNLIPGGWQQDIDTAELTVRLPVASEDDVECAVGVGARYGCVVDGAGTDTVVVTVGELDRNIPLTIRTGLDLAPPPIEDQLPWAPRWDRVLGTSVTGLWVVGGLALLAGVVGLSLGARVREVAPSFPLQYAPPEGIGPAQAAYLLTEKIDRRQYVATLMHAAEHGAITLEKRPHSWQISDTSGTDGWAGLDPVSISIAHLLSGPGTTFRASTKDADAGKRLQTEIAAFEDEVRTWALASGHMTSSALGPFGAMTVVVSMVAFAINTVANPFDMTVLGLVPGLFAIGGLSLLLPGSSTRRTRSGRELWSRIGGFHRVLSTPSSKDRFDFSGREELYTAYVPWAVAFGCADEWATRYRTEVGSEPPTPSYFPAYAGMHSVDHVSSMVGDFDSTVSGAISAYSATQSSSSSGGGGFSGGGGGGGGGGGSW